MKKQNKKNTKEKKGFVLYTDDLVAAEELLPDFERRGQLLSIITAYATGRELPQVPDIVRASFVYIRNGIIANNAKYERKLERQSEYNQRQREKMERLTELERAAKSQVPQVEKVAQTPQATQSSINNSINNGDGNGDGNGTGNSTGNGNGNRHGNNNSNKNTVNSISSNTEYLKNNSLSETVYTPEEVEAILREKEIFFKPSEFKKFYLLNEAQYHWKYDPYVAALTYIERHPNSTKKAAKGGESAPQYAAPPNLANARSEIDADLRINAERLWQDTLRAELAKEVPIDDSGLIFDLMPLSLELRGYSNYTLLLGLRNESRKRMSENDDVEKFDRVRTLIRQNLNIFKAYRITEVKLV